MGLFGRFFGNRVRDQIEHSRNHIVGLNLCVFLSEKYKKRFGEEKAMALAAAVTNELFGQPPGNEMGREFLASNKPLVEEELRNIKNEPQVCRIVSVFTHMLGNVAGNSCKMSPEWLLHAARLRDLGILLPAEKIQIPSSLEGLMQQARQFEFWVIQNSSAHS